MGACSYRTRESILHHGANVNTNFKLFLKIVKTNRRRAAAERLPCRSLCRLGEEEGDRRALALLTLYPHISTMQTHQLANHVQADTASTL